ncbi:MAG: DUF4345 domain-containing protein [bacterium]|nr:DUF4345 domain-containing protein [bacterium]
MKLAKIYLLAFAVFSLVFGLGYLFAPQMLAQPAGFGVLSAAATTDVRATYGGFQIGMGAFLIWSAQSQDRYYAALWLVALSIAAVFASRMIGVVLDGELGDFHRLGLVIESSLTVATLFVLRKVRGLAGSPVGA